MMANMRADVGDEIIYAYVQMQFGMTKTSTMTTYIHMNGE